MSRSKRLSGSLARPPKDHACGCVGVSGTRFSSHRHAFCCDLHARHRSTAGPTQPVRACAALAASCLPPGARVGCRPAEDSRKCQTSTATPAKPGDLPFWFRVARLLLTPMGRGRQPKSATRRAGHGLAAAVLANRQPIPTADFHRHTVRLARKPPRAAPFPEEVRVNSPRTGLPEGGGTRDFTRAGVSESLTSPDAGFWLGPDSARRATFQSVPFARPARHVAISPHQYAHCTQPLRTYPH